MKFKTTRTILFVRVFYFIGKLMEFRWKLKGRGVLIRAGV